MIFMYNLWINVLCKSFFWKIKMHFYKQRSDWPREMSLFLEGLDKLGGGLVVVEDGLLGGGLVVSHPLAGPAGWGVRPARRRGLTVAARRGGRGGGAGVCGWAMTPAQEQRHTLDQGSGLHTDSRDCGCSQCCGTTRHTK